VCRVGGHPWEPISHTSILIYSNASSKHLGYSSKNDPVFALVSFTQNPYIGNHEAYKYQINRAGRDMLAFQDWKQSDIGSGRIWQ
jgi:hypothetical protein